MKIAISVSDADHLNFFRIYDGSLMDTIALSWCKLFGSPRSEKIHWTKLFPETATEVRPRLDDQFRATVGDLDALSRCLRNYRDTYIAHHDLDQGKRSSRHPHLEPLQATGWILYKDVFDALETAGQTYGLCHPSNITSPKLEEIEAHWKSISEAARAATEHFRERPASE